jgi:hypothetical protein
MAADSKSTADADIEGIFLPAAAFEEVAADRLLSGSVDPVIWTYSKCLLVELPWLLLSLSRKRSIRRFVKCGFDGG